MFGRWQAGGGRALSRFLITCDYRSIYVVRDRGEVPSDSRCPSQLVVCGHLGL